MIEGYAREAGVRQLEKQLHSIVRKAAVKLLEGGQESVRISVKNLEEYLGAPLFRQEQVLKGEGWSPDWPGPRWVAPRCRWRLARCTR